MAAVIHLHRYRVRWWTETDGVRTIREATVCGSRAATAILRARRSDADRLFGPERKGRVISVVREGR